MFFFFQAEDGIRDLIVTGVQTCALPICYTGTVVVRPEELMSKRLRKGVRNIGIKFPIHGTEFIGWDVLHFARSVKFLEVTQSDFKKMIDSVKINKFDSCKRLEIIRGNGVSFDDIASLLPNLESIEFTRGQAISFRGIEKHQNLKEIWLIGISQPVRIAANMLPETMETIMLSSSSKPIIEGDLGNCKIVQDEAAFDRVLYVN